MPHLWHPQPESATATPLWDMSLIWRRLNGEQNPMAVRLDELKARFQEMRLHSPRSPETE